MSLSLSAAQVNPTTNYLVPSSGSTNAVPLSGALTGGTPAILDWRQFNTDSMAFQPQGAYIDNSAGTAKLTIAIHADGPSGPLVWTVTVDAGHVQHANFPAPNGQGHVINGAGEVSIVYVDFPVLPFDYAP